MKILAIETSCDDSGIAILEISGTKNQPRLLANLISSQVKLHAKWGGVVPMLAKREHQRNLTPLLTKALKEAKLLKIQKPESKTQELNSKLKILKEEILEREDSLVKKLIPFLKKYQNPDFDYIAITHGPGLEPALWVGVNFARALSFFWDIPLLPINHIEGHIAANFILEDKVSEIPNFQIPRPQRLSVALAGAAIFNKNHKAILPAICLVVSGGHTQIILIKEFGDYKIIGETRDDAAGEAFDKVAKMLDLGYPGGPAISKLAEKWKSQIPNPKSQIPNHQLPRPMMHSGDFDFSFSGLKTAVLYRLQKMTKKEIKKSTPAIAAEFEQAVVDVLTKKTIAAAKEYGAKSLWLSGGVAANQSLRHVLEKSAQENNLDFSAPENQYCTDNAAMIAQAAYQKLQNNQAQEISWQELKAQANLRIS